MLLASSGYTPYTAELPARPQVCLVPGLLQQVLVEPSPTPHTFVRGLPFRVPLAGLGPLSSWINVKVRFSNAVRNPVQTLTGIASFLC